MSGAVEKRNVALADHETTVTRRRGEGLPLVLVHSLALDHREWDEFIDQCPTDLDIVAYDVRGHGQHAPPTRFDMAACAEDLAALLDVLQLQQVHLCGLSMGGVIAQEFAIRQSQRLAALTLMATIARGSADVAARGHLAAGEDLEDRVTPTLERWFTREFLARNGPAVAYARECLLSLDLGVWRQAWAALGGTDTWANLPDIDVPTLCLAGTQDASTPPSVLRGIADRLPNGRLATVDGPHLFAIETPKATADAVAEHHRTVR